MKNLFIDDIRPLPSTYDPNEWEIATSYNQAIEYLTQNQYHTISLDHDLASFDKNGKEYTGYDIVKWLIERHMDNEYTPQQYLVHSANPIGATNMLKSINRYLLKKV